MRETTFLLGLAIAAVTLITLARTVAMAISGRGGSRSELAAIREQLEQQAAALEDAQADAAQQATQLAELHERLDFTERVLAQAKERAALGSGEKRQ